MSADRRDHHRLLLLEPPDWQEPVQVQGRTHARVLFRFVAVPAAVLGSAREPAAAARLPVMLHVPAAAMQALVEAVGGGQQRAALQRTLGQHLLGWVQDWLRQNGIEEVQQHDGLLHVPETADLRCADVHDVAFEFDVPARRTAEAVADAPPDMDST